MNKETIEIPLVKATYEELQQVICELQVEKYKYKFTLHKIKEYIKENVNWDMDDFTKMELAGDILELLEEIE